MKPLQLCIFILKNNRSVSGFSFYNVFDTSPIITFNIRFPPISDNNYFSFTIHFPIRIFDAFNCIVSNSLFPGVIPRLLFILFSIRGIRFSLSVKMSYSSKMFPTLITFLVLPNFLNHVIASSFTHFCHWVII